MRGVNKITLLGNLGKDPEVQTLQGDIKVAKFSLATSEVYKDDKGQLQTHTEWHTIVLWRGLADLAEKLLHKDRKSTRLNSSHRNTSRMPSSA